MNIFRISMKEEIIVSIIFLEFKSAISRKGQKISSSQNDCGKILHELALWGAAHLVEGLVSGAWLYQGLRFVLLMSLKILPFSVTWVMGLGVLD